jgi:chromosome segregation ATPase
MATSIGQERAQVLAKRIRGLIDKRKEHHEKIDTLKKRIRQSQLTYADLMRKRNRLENSLADLKVTLDSDEQLLEAEARSVDDIPAEIEQASAELAALISG